MNLMKGEWGNRFRLVSNHADAVLAFGVVGLILLLILPVPPMLLDALLCLSIIFSVMVLLLTFYVEKPLDFSAFPSVLLFLTLFRLGLNISSTRMILTRGEAGDLIQTFGGFVIQGNLVVGMILFGLLTIINFVVVTKGAGRIAEVTARFTLEALPGKQMAIDSELSSGLISQSQAKQERAQLASETDFYGSMDGASKFVKGDAIAGLLITCVNILGGFVVGMTVKGLSWQECCTVMTRLTIGDGLVSQIPALLISVGAAMMVTRSSTGSLGKTVPQQIFHQPKVLLASASIILALSLIPGMPKFVMLSLSALLIGVGIIQLRQKKTDENEIQTTQMSSLFVSPLEVHLGYQIVLFAEPLKERINEIRDKIAAHLGVSIPAVKILDQADLSPKGWSILIRGVRVAQGRDPELSFLVKRLTQVCESHAHELINRQVVTQMLQEVKSYDSAVVDELLGKKLSTGKILKILQNLLKEGVPIRDFVTILEILADNATGEESDLSALTEEVRWALSGGISEEFFGKSRAAHVITVDPKVEQMLSVAKGGVKPKVLNQISRSIERLYEHAQKQGVNPVVVTAVHSRIQLKKLIEKQLPSLPVLSYKEIGVDIELNSIGVVSNEVLV